jgi:hypothetical protein
MPGSAVLCCVGVCGRQLLCEAAHMLTICCCLCSCCGGFVVVGVCGQLQPHQATEEELLAVHSPGLVAAAAANVHAAAAVADLSL